ncbi:uncharacterized protein BT62DRAFT_996060 [Guyanagaster necrorhizus]|uniref:Uncharacterized protein n=1 Tax=Guyanagaster necrorhizus TaxID=856835 RepID=A0A9P7VMD9_9AGAR|nr:uncharacterized protein BT62DRAFT_996060 [Guyanagaster necrorhizus MCA 3950]KAG7443198.1 hypothetical protein BT62DRAFT_996060 [Guyanagaster necrorhizus MCA 3950]
MPEKGKKRFAPFDAGESPKRIKTNAVLLPVGEPSRLRSIASPNAQPRGRLRAYANALRPTVALNPSTPLQVFSPESPYKLGSFDFWPITNKSLELAAASGLRPDYEAIFDLLSTWQNQGIADCPMRCFIPDLPNAQNPNEKGRMRCVDMRDPVSGEIHEIAITSLALTDAFKCDIPNFPLRRDGETIESVMGNTFIANIPTTGVVSSSGGVFKMNCSPVWSAVYDNRENSAHGTELCEVFEGYLEMAGTYNPQGYDAGEGYRFQCGFWGVRSRYSMLAWDPLVPCTDSYIPMDVVE